MEHSYDIVIVLILLGIADYTMTRIIMKGSVFEPLRDYLQSPTRWRLKKKLNEMFSCHLCLGAQLSLWSLSLPLHVYAGSPFVGFLQTEQIPTMVFTIGSWFITSMIITGVHYWIWAKTVAPRPQDNRNPPIPAELLQLLLQPNETTPANNPPDSISFEPAHVLSGFEGATISFGEFSALFFVCQFSCDNYTCRYAGPACVGDIVERFVQGKLMRIQGLPGIGSINKGTADIMHTKLSKAIHNGMYRMLDDPQYSLGNAHWFKFVREVYTDRTINEEIPI